MSTVILTCAGKSTRFPDHRPKWSLTHPNGNLMAAESIKGLKGITRLIVAMSGDDMKRFGRENILAEMRVGCPSNTGIQMVDVGDSPSHVGTIRRAIWETGLNGSFTAKDCDNYFEYEVPEGNAVAVADLMEVGRIDPSNKGYVAVAPRGDEVVDIRERKAISHLFSCGAYSFADADEFYKWSQGCNRVSEVIRMQMSQGFKAFKVNNYVDWGTAEDWLSYTAQFKTLFVDIDGVLVEASHRTFSPKWGESPVIQANIDYLNRLAETGKVEIILTTSRPEIRRGQTVNQLQSLKYHRLIMGLRNCGRYLVNDYVSKRGQHTCFAINVERDSELLEQALGRNK